MSRSAICRTSVGSRAGAVPSAPFAFSDTTVLEVASVNGVFFSVQFYDSTTVWASGRDRIHAMIELGGCRIWSWSVGVSVTAVGGTVWPGEDTRR